MANENLLRRELRRRSGTNILEKIMSRVLGVAIGLVYVTAIVYVINAFIRLVVH